MKPKLIAIIVIVVLFLIILAQNAHVVTLNLLFWKISVSQFILILFTAVIAFVLGYTVSEVVKMKSKHSA